MVTWGKGKKMKGYQSTIGWLCYLSKFYFPLGYCSRPGVLHEKQCQARHSNGLLSADKFFKNPFETGECEDGEGPLEWCFMLLMASKWKISLKTRNVWTCSFIWQVLVQKTKLAEFTFFKQLCTWNSSLLLKLQVITVIKFSYSMTEYS